MGHDARGKRWRHKSPGFLYVCGCSSPWRCSSGPTAAWPAGSQSGTSACHLAHSRTSVASQCAYQVTLQRSYRQLLSALAFFCSGSGTRPQRKPPQPPLPPPPPSLLHSFRGSLGACAGRNSTCARLVSGEETHNHRSTNLGSFVHRHECRSTAVLLCFCKRDASAWPEQCPFESIESLSLGQALDRTVPSAQGHRPCCTEYYQLLCVLPACRHRQYDWPRAGAPLPPLLAVLAPMRRLRSASWAIPAWLDRAGRVSRPDCTACYTSDTAAVPRCMHTADSTDMAKPQNQVGQCTLLQLNI